jgi:hypothetical protein
MAPPTIARLNSIGVSAFRVTCDQMMCRQSAFVAFAAAGVEDSAEFSSICVSVAALFARVAAGGR